MSFAGAQLGRYHLLHLIGQGGMGEVYLAQDSRINRQVAIKVLRTEPWSAYNTASQQEAARLFQREAQAIAMLDHPAILPLFDYGEEQINGAQVTYLVMPYRAEGTLKDWLSRRSATSTSTSATPLSPQDVAALISQAASALQYAHNNNIIHQDVKPSNFLIRSNPDHPSRPDILLADFGIARFVNATTQLSQGPHGTPAYMAPEQWEGKPTPASDQYALAVMAYELLTGTLPFHGGMGQLMYSHHYRTPPPPRQHNPSLSPDIDHILLTALAKQPEARFASISAFANALQQAVLASSSGTSPTPLTPPLPPLPPTHHTLHTSSAAATPAPVPPFEQQQRPPTGHSFHSAPTSPETYSPPTNRPGYSPTLPPGAQSPDSLSSSPIPSFPPTPPFQQAEKLTSPTPTPSFAASTTTPSQRTEHPQPFPDQYPKTIRNAARTVTIAALVLLLIVAGGFGAFFFYNNQRAASQFSATATAESLQSARASATAVTAQTVQSTTATAQAAQSSTSAGATATAQAISSATDSTKNPYPPSAGTLALSDPLMDNTKGNKWAEDSDISGSCSFVGQTYHALMLLPGIEYCFAQAASFTNVAYQVQMTLVKGDSGGLLLRGAPPASKFYYCFIRSDGSYGIHLYTDKSTSPAGTLASGTSPAIHTGFGQSNLLAVVAQGNALELYVNLQKVATVRDTTYQSGYVGVAVHSSLDATEGVFQHARVWKL